MEDIHDRQHYQFFLSPQRNTKATDAAPPSLAGTDGKAGVWNEIRLEEISSVCTYWMVGDWQFKTDPPFRVDPIQWPTVPQPPKQNPFVPWELSKLVEFQDIIRRVKELEDKLGCPCEPNKADYLKLIQDRINELRKMG